MRPPAFSQLVLGPFPHDHQTPPSRTEENSKGCEQVVFFYQGLLSLRFDFLSFNRLSLPNGYAPFFLPLSFLPPANKNRVNFPPNPLLLRFGVFMVPFLPVFFFFS